MLDDHTPSRPWWQRLGWLALIWLLSVLALALAAALLRLIMGAAGLHA